MEWRVKAIRGATTATANTKEAITEAVLELLEELESRNDLDPNDIISAIFTATPDLNAIFPASVARQRPNWNNVALLDVQQLQIEGSLERCIRFLIHVNLPIHQAEIYHPYLRGASDLRPDWNLGQIATPCPQPVESHSY